MDYISIEEMSNDEINSLFDSLLINNKISDACSLIDYFIKTGKTGTKNEKLSNKLFYHLLNIKNFNEMIKHLKSKDDKFEKNFNYCVRHYRARHDFNERNMNNNEFILSVIFKNVASLADSANNLFVYLRLSDVFGRQSIKKIFNLNNVGVQFSKNKVGIKLNKLIVFECDGVHLKFEFSYFFAMEPGIFKFISYFNDGDTFIDVGANIGKYSIAAAVLRNTNTFSFEPFNTNFSALEQNIAINDLNGIVFPMNLSVSNNCGTSKIFYNTDKNFAGAADQKIILESSPDNNKIKNYNTHIVDTITIDQIVIFKNIKNDYHIKIDIDGSEYIVIEGMSNALQDEKLKSIRLEIRQDNEKNINAVAKIKKSGFEIMIGDDEKNLHFFRN